MQTVPQEFADDPSVAAYFEASLYANLKEEEKLEYDKIMDTKYDIEDSLLDAELKGEKRGIAQGRAESKLEIARAMMAKGIDLSTIAECTGLSEKQIKQI